LTKDRRKGLRAAYKKSGPFNRFVFWGTIVAIVIAVVALILTLLFGVYIYALTKRDAIHLTNITRTRPVPFVRKFPVIIEDGGNTQVLPKPQRYSPIYSLCPFIYHIKPDGSINLRGEIRDEKGVIVTEATGDSIRVVQAKRYDINSDSKAIEVVDINKQPVFQLMVIPFENFIREMEQRRSMRDKEMRQQKTTKNLIMLLEKAKQQMTEEHRKKEIDETIERVKQTNKFDDIENLKKMKIDEVIRLSYINQRDEIWLIASTHGIRSFKSLGENERSLIPRLFCYPGYSYPGKRVDQ